MMTIVFGGQQPVIQSSPHFLYMLPTAYIGNFDTKSPAFDGVLSKGYLTCARKTPSSSGYGNTLGVYHGGNSAIVSSFYVYGPNDLGILGSGTSNAMRLLGSPDGTTWNTLYEGVYPSGSSAIASVTSGIDTATAYKYHAVDLYGNGSNGLSVSQIKFAGYFV